MLVLSDQTVSGRAGLDQESLGLTVTVVLWCEASSQAPVYIL